MLLARSQAADHGVGGGGLAQHQLGDLAVQVVAEGVEQVDRAAAAGAAVDELDLHGLGDHRRRVRADLADRAEQQVDVFLARPVVVAADPERQAIDLGERHPVLQGVVLEHVDPADRPGQAAADRQARLGLVVVDDELPGRQRDQQPVVGIHLRRLAIDVVGVEPAGVAPLQAARDPLALGGVPDDLGVRAALADRIEHVDQLVLQLVALQPVADEVGLLDLVGR